MASSFAFGSVGRSGRVTAGLLHAGISGAFRGGFGGLRDFRFRAGAGGLGARLRHDAVSFVLWGAVMVAQSVQGCLGIRVVGMPVRELALDTWKRPESVFVGMDILFLCCAVGSRMRRGLLM